MASKNHKSQKNQTLTLRLTQKSPIRKALNKTRDKTMNSLKSSIPSYFNRHYRGMPQTSNSSNILKRYFSPQTLKSPSHETKPEELQGVIQDPLMSLLLLSNGIELYKVYEPNYKYFVSPGNNDVLIRKILKQKTGWSKSFSPHSANLIWTEVRKSSMFDLVPKGQTNKKTVIEHKSSEKNSILAESEFRALMTTSTFNPLKVKIYNKLEGNSELSLKKKLFANMNQYYKAVDKDPFEYIPVTFHLINGENDKNFQKFAQMFEFYQENCKSDPLLNNLWVIKPGEATNRGVGISVCGTMQEILQIVNQKIVKNNIKRTFIVQKYIYRPLLYRNRKFDIRCYVLVTIFNNNIQGYLYKEGYLRTSCSEFSLSQVNDKFIHLTNDAIQKNSPDYGKFEDGNKLSYQEFQDYLDEIGQSVQFKETVYPKIKEMARDSLIATWKLLDLNKRFHCFEVFGYDFMLDEMFKPWLIEVNTNPCLALSGKYLSTLIPSMLEHSFEIVLDQLFPTNVKLSGTNDYELIFSQVLHDHNPNLNQ